MKNLKAQAVFSFLSLSLGAIVQGADMPAAAVQALLTFDADINAGDNAGMIELMHAPRNNQIDVITQLLGHADITLGDLLFQINLLNRMPAVRAARTSSAFGRICAYSRANRF